MKLASVANSYAKAILEIGIETNQVDVFAEELEQILFLLQKDNQGWEFFVSPRVPKKAKLDVMRKSFDKKINPNLLNALSVIINHDRIYFLPEIYKAYNLLNDERKGVLRAEVFSAVKLKEPQLKEIQ
ncbi:MAG: ATP synthase F1 subunit delta, partial [Leptospiraceae bacterium]|nr:ATP synthase F1 subunit delta [Leptospiraceae bacterium]